LALWKLALQKISAHPIIGSGFAQSDMSEDLAYTSDPIYPHNIFLEVAVELGLTGLILFTIPLFIGLKRAYHSFQSANPAKGIDVDLVLLLFVFNLIEAQMSGFLTNQAQLLFMMGISGGLYRWEIIPLHTPRQIAGGVIFGTVASYYQHSNHTLMRNNGSYEN
jgi:O-antigen ligase